MVACAPQLVGQFVYHDHTPANVFELLFSPSALAKWLVSRDLVLAQHFARNFWWHHVMLFPSQMPDVLVVCLSTHDEYVPVEFVEKLLAQKVPLPRGKQVLKKVLYLPGAHSAFLLSPEAQDNALAVFKENIDASG